MIRVGEIQKQPPLASYPQALAQCLWRRQLYLESEDLNAGFATYCVTLDQSLPLSGAQFPHPYSEMMIPPHRDVENIW